MTQIETSKSSPTRMFIDLQRFPGFLVGFLRDLTATFALLSKPQNFAEELPQHSAEELPQHSECQV